MLRRHCGLAIVLLLASGLGGAAARGAPAGGTITADANDHFAYPLDAGIVRDFTVTNTSGRAATVLYRVREGGICLPQPGNLYLASGESVTIECRIEWAIAFPDSRSWPEGRRHVPVTIDVTSFAEVPGFDVSATFDNVVDVTRAPRANATVSGTVVDATSKKPLEGARIAIDNDEGGTHATAVSAKKGTFRAAVVAHRRAVPPSWQEQVVTVTAPGHEAAVVVVAPQTGRTSKVRIALRRSVKSRAKYTQAAALDGGVAPGRGDASADGRYVATASWADFGPDKDAIVAAGSRLTLNDTVAGKQLWSRPLGWTVPRVDVSDDGAWVLTVDPRGSTGIAGSSFQNGVTLLDRAGTVVWSIPPPRENPYRAGASMGASDVQLTHDGSRAAFGSFDGQLQLVDRATHTARWKTFLRGMIRWIRFSPDDSRLFVSSGNENLYALDAASGAQLWHTNIHGFALIAAQSANHLYVVGKAGRLASLVRQSDGSVVWTHPVLAAGDALAASPDESRFFYGVTVPNALKSAMLDRTGKTIWAAPHLGGTYGARGAAFSPDGRYLLVLASNVGLGRDSAQLYTAAGRLLWSKQLGASGPWGSGEAAFVWLSAGAKRLVLTSPLDGHLYVFAGSPGV
ncbi:MAG TPA: PQQ-binding-like beta-propeller repeat protein [Gaiellaceae bacterium]|nr:PQQ-binding-like beta-propeller repeat protein [Gaiellaceae bacterium]